MICYHYCCTLLSEVIVSPTAATAGFRESLDYLPGAKFWGIVAQELYGKEGIDTLRLFHDGSVCFGDAHLVINKERSHRAPLGWIKDKFDKNEDQPTVYVQPKTDMRAFLVGNGKPEDGKQPEAHAPGYINNGGHYARPLQAFSIKSAYDSENRRSKDAAMYGYYALTAGSEWAFTIQSEDASLLEDVKKALHGKTHGIGRSRSAQYGQVKIEYERKENIVTQWLEAGTLIYLYADSAWMLPIEGGLVDALKDTATIEWQKSQIRTRIYQSWNGHRHSPDPDRTIVEKGSVLAISPTQRISVAELMKPLRDRRAEGFGEVVVNPAFLDINPSPQNTIEEGRLSATYQPTNEKKVEIKSKVANRFEGEMDTNLTNAVQRRQDVQKLTIDIDANVNHFVEKHKKDFSKASASQWGAVRQHGRQAQNAKALEDDLLDDKIGFLNRGASKDKWSDSDREHLRDLLKGLIAVGEIPEKDRPLYLRKLSAEMAKKARNKKEKNHHP